jgi:ribosomal protein S18 acetylase RimI-like enzyme
LLFGDKIQPAHFNNDKERQMNTELRPLLDHELKDAVDLMNLGFSDYFVHIELTLPMFLNMIRMDGIDPGSSRLIYVDGEAAGIALIARRGWTSRLAAMCLSPAYRGQHAGRAAMDQLISEARSRGDHRMVLEVIEDNAPGVRLYEACGFKIQRRLVSFEGTFSQSDAEATLQPVDIRDVARWVTIHGLDELPWQLSGESLVQSSSPNTAFCLEQAYIVISNPEAEQIAIRSLIVLPEARGQGQAARLVEAVRSAFPNRKWLIPALCPEEIRGFFKRLQFERGALSQLQMSIDLQHQA